MYGNDLNPTSYEKNKKSYLGNDEYFNRNYCN